MQNIILIILIILTGLTSYGAFNDGSLFDKLKFNAYAIKHEKQWYRFFSHAFVHANWMHLIFNLYVLWAFGEIVLVFFKYYFGAAANLYFLGLYIPAIAASSLRSYFLYRDDYLYNAVGASGAVSAIVFASIILYPQGKMGLIFFPVMIPSWIFGGLYIIYTVIMSKKNIDNIGHDAHLWGAVYGIAYTLLTVPHALERFISGIIG